LYARTRREATQLAQRFEEFMDTYYGFFKQLGITEILFEEERKPQVSSEYRQDLPHRTVSYSVKIERISTIRSIDLVQFETAIRASSGLDPVTDQQPEPQPIVSDGGFMSLYKQHFPR